MEIVQHLKPSSGPLNTLQSNIFKNIFEYVAPQVHSIINLSLMSRCVPDCFKLAIIQTVLRVCLDHKNMNNFRKISKLAFLSKILEKAVSSQLVQALEDNNMFEVFQSGFHQKHNTESSLLRILNDILMCTDTGDILVQVLLDLPADFDTLHHCILLDRLSNWVGLSAWD